MILKNQNNSLFYYIRIMNALGVELIFGAFIEKIKTVELINSKNIFEIGIYSI